MIRQNLVLLSAVVAMSGSLTWAAVHTTQNDSSQYGHLDQNYESVNYGPVACGPAAVVNSFEFLQNEYGFTGLLAADPHDTINTLETYMNTAPPGGTSIGDLITGKRDYIADKGLSSYISVEGETTFNLGIEGVADNTKPTWDFLFDQIEAGQDVESLINWWDGAAYTGTGHFITITGMTWDDTLDTGTLSFIDPWGGLDIVGTLGMHNGFMQLTYAGGAAANPEDPDNPDHESVADISSVVAESPIPEPGTVSLMAVGLLTVMRRRR